MGHTIEKLFALIKDRQAHPKEGSYTNHLFHEGTERIAQKVGEESVEVIVAAMGQGDERMVSEMADLTYHCLVLLAHHGLTPDDIAQELEKRYTK